MFNGPKVATGYGIDFGDGFLAAARCRGRRCDALPDAGAAASAIAAAQRRGGALVAAALPAGDCTVRRLSVPLRSRSRARRVLSSLLDPQLPFPLESCAAAFSEIRRAPDGGFTALAVAAPRDLLRRRLERVRAAGFDPAAIVPEGLALWAGSVREAPPIGPNAARVALYAGADRWVAAAGIGREFRWSVSTPPPPSAAAPAAAEALTPVLRRLRADGEFRNATLDWRWCGPAVPEDSLLDELRTSIAAERPCEFSRHADGEALLARALARAARDAGAALGNLRSGEDEHPDLAALRDRREKRGWLALAAVGLALVAVNLFGGAAVARRDADAQSALEQAVRSVAGTSRVPRGRELAAARTALDERREALKPFVRGTSAVAATSLATALRQAAGQEIAIQELQISDEALLVAGGAPRRAAAEALSAGLEREGWKTALNWTSGAGETGVFEVRGTRP